MSDSYPGESSSAARSRVHPGGPAGLRDNPQLRDVLRKQDEYMKRLVNASLRTLTASPAVQPPPSHSFSAAGTHGGPRCRGGFPQYTPDHPTTAPTGVPWPPHGAQGPVFRGDDSNAETSTGGGPYVPVQMLWWQQMYAWHYYIQQQVATTAASSSQVPPSSPIASAAEPSGAMPHGPAGAWPMRQPSFSGPDPAPARWDIRANAAPRRQQQAAANAGDEPAPSPDWLERLYTVSNVCVLLSIMYFSSSASLLVIVAGAMLLVYLHQNAWFPFRPEQQQNPGGGGEGGERGRAHGEEAETRHDTLGEAAQPAAGGGGGEGGSEGNGHDAGATVRQAPQGFLAAIWTFFTAFFLSLIPEGHPYTAN